MSAVATSAPLLGRVASAIRPYPPCLKHPRRRRDGNRNFRFGRGIATEQFDFTGKISDSGDSNSYRPRDVNCPNGYPFPLGESIFTLAACLERHTLAANPVLHFCHKIATNIRSCNNRDAFPAMVFAPGIRRHGQRAWHTAHCVGDAGFLTISTN